jgi:hypothetical protein
MAITGHPGLREIGEVLAERAAQEPLVRELWVTEFEHEAHVWLLIEPTDDADAERALYGLVDVLWDHFPEGGFVLRVMNPLDYKGDPRTSFDADAIQIPLRTR